MIQADKPRCFRCKSSNLKIGDKFRKTLFFRGRTPRGNPTDCVTWKYAICTSCGQNQVLKRFYYSGDDVE